MPGTLTYSPADVVRRLLIALGQGVAPGSSPWPVFAAGEPDLPDEVITVYDTAGRDHGRTHTEGERQEHHGIQIRIRAQTHKAGWTKARAIAVALDEAAYQDFLTLDGIPYLVHAVSRTTDVLALGKETPTSKRSIFTINALVSLREV